MATPNVFLLAADNSPDLLPLLRKSPWLASSQDEHGYSLIHAAASYNHLNLLRSLGTEFLVDVDLKDEDGETALYVVETVDCAKVLVEELKADIKITGVEGKTATESITDAGEFPEVAVYLRMKELEGEVVDPGSAEKSGLVYAPPPLAGGITMNFSTMVPEDAGEVADPEFRRRIEELASRDDFEAQGGQELLRALITEAIRGEVGHDRQVRQKTG